MRNPFKCTGDYMIVREYNRLNQRKRTHSSSSSASLSRKYCNHKGNFLKQFNKPITANQNRFQAEYLMRLPQYLIQKKRVQLYGMDQLRYAPCETYDRNPNLKTDEKGKRGGYAAIEQQEDKYQDYFTNKMLKSTKQLGNYNQKESITPQGHDGLPNSNSENISKLNRRQSMLSQMIDINLQELNGNNLYISVADFKSRRDTLRSYMSIPGHQKKRNSLFRQSAESIEGRVISQHVQNNSHDSFKEQESQNIAKQKYRHFCTKKKKKGAMSFGEFEGRQEQPQSLLITYFPICVKVKGKTYHRFQVVNKLY